jgi:hypothetical protein
MNTTFFNICPLRTSFLAIKMSVFVFVFLQMILQLSVKTSWVSYTNITLTLFRTIMVEGSIPQDFPISDAMHKCWVPR